MRVDVVEYWKAPRGPQPPPEAPEGTHSLSHSLTVKRTEGGLEGTSPVAETTRAWGRSARLDE